MTVLHTVWEVLVFQDKMPAVYCILHLLYIFPPKVRLMYITEHPVYLYTLPLLCRFQGTTQWHKVCNLCPNRKVVIITAEHFYLLKICVYILSYRLWCSEIERRTHNRKYFACRHTFTVVRCRTFRIDLRYLDYRLYRLRVPQD